MKERPILFSAPMVRAILEGRKTQTRRVVKGQPFRSDVSADEVALSSKVPYGGCGDRLWVRETFGLGSENRICHKSDEEIFYRATDPAWDAEKTGFRWKPSIFMPRALSRITLEITGVRAERLQDMSAVDAISEGIIQSEIDGLFAQYPIDDEHPRWLSDPVESFETLWRMINGINSWKLNPWVWVIAFKKL